MWGAGGARAWAPTPGTTRGEKAPRRGPTGGGEPGELGKKGRGTPKHLAGGMETTIGCTMGWTTTTTPGGRDHDPAALGVLKGLKERGLKTGLLSNTHWPRALHERWLHEAGLLAYLDVRLYTSDMTHMKPHPTAFQALLEAIGVTADKAVFVGDRNRDDIRGAQSAGMRAVLLSGRHPVGPTDVAGCRDEFSCRASRSGRQLVRPGRVGPGSTG